MKFKDIENKLDCKILHKSSSYDSAEITHIMASDLMSDVLVIEDNLDLIVTSLATDQVIRTADIVDTHGIIIVNNKKATEHMIEMAKDFDVTLISAKETKYQTCCLIHDLESRK